MEILVKTILRNKKNAEERWILANNKLCW